MDANDSLPPVECDNAYTSLFDRATRRRGEAYFRQDAVVELVCVEAGRFYEAVVRGGQDYQVVLEYDEDSGWVAECSCPVGFECKHIYAAMLALRSPKFLARLQTSMMSAKAAGKTAAKAAVKAPAKPAEPESALSGRVLATLGRKLTSEERVYLRGIQALLKASHDFRRPPTPYDMQKLAPGFTATSWAPLDLWPEPPKDDFEMWLYCAWEMRRRGFKWPSFLDPVTDFNAIEARMKSWEREKSIQLWRQQLANARVTGRQPRNEEQTDLRVVILPNRAAIEWRARADVPFAELKQTHLRKLMQAHESGTLELTAEAAPLWYALYRPYDYYTWSNLRFNDPGVVRTLNRIFRLPNFSGRIVNADGVPMIRATEALRFQMRSAERSEDDYLLRLVRADGTLPPILLMLEGRPALYVSADTVYEGPPPHGFGPEPELTIPAPALESEAGLSFLHTLGLEPPPRLASRTRKVFTKVKMFFELKPSFPDSRTDAVFARVQAESDSAPVEVFTGYGWEVRGNSERARKAPGPDDFIALLDRAAQSHFPALMESLAAKWETYPGRWRIKLNKQFPEMFVRWIEALPPNVEVLLDKELATLRDAPLAGNVRLDVEEAGVDWFDLRVVLDVSDTELTPDELKLLLNARGGWVRLGAKGWRRLQFNLTEEDDEQLARIGLSPRDFSAEPQRLHALQLADPAAARLLPAQRVEDIQRRVGELKARVNPPVPAAIRAELRPYQIEGFHFLAYLTANRFGGVLADDMGLGKTVQALAWIAWLREQSSTGVPPASQIPDRPAGAETGPAASSEINAVSPNNCSLVVCPKSVMDNWRAEAERFLPGLRVHLWRGEGAEALDAARSQADLIVVNYAQLRSLSPPITQAHWRVVLLDEAQYIKNPDSQTAQVARALQTEHRLALTGTPIENRLLDLWSILAFAMPGVLGNRTQFLKKFDQKNDPLARRRLAARARPFLLRRTKGQVATDLPDRIEEDLHCELEGQQKTLYTAEFKRARRMLLGLKTDKDLNKQRFNFLTSLLRLRQICCHPALVDASLRTAESAKVNALIDLLEPLMEEGHKVLVFSQFVTMLDLLRETVQQREWPHFYLAGDTEDRGPLVQKFQNAKGAAVFLISLKAGGFGLNLTAASYVVMFDPWWNPAVENQAIDRTHRIGQTSKVIAYRLLMKDSIEEKIRRLQKTKAALAEDVLGEETFARSLTIDDLKFLFAEDATGNS